MSHESANDQTEDMGFFVQGMFGARSRLPMVMLTIGDRKPLQITTAKAREIAQMLQECAESAEQDGFIVRFVTEKLQATEKQAALLLGEFRTMRDEWKTERE